MDGHPRQNPAYRPANGKPRRRGAFPYSRHGVAALIGRRDTRSAAASSDVVLWISGETVLYGGVRQVADRLQVNTVLMHLGGIRFPVTGPVRYRRAAPSSYAA
jgi:hypothetical protein